MLCCFFVEGAPNWHPGWWWFLGSGRTPQCRLSSRTRWGQEGRRGWIVPEVTNHCHCVWCQVIASKPDQQMGILPHVGLLIPPIRLDSIYFINTQRQINCSSKWHDFKKFTALIPHHIYNVCYIGVEGVSSWKHSAVHSASRLSGCSLFSITMSSLWSILLSTTTCRGFRVVPSTDPAFIIS